MRAFNRIAFQKFGGIEGLLTRFLERTLGRVVATAQRTTNSDVKLNIKRCVRRETYISLYNQNSQLRHNTPYKLTCLIAQTTRQYFQSTSVDFCY